ncbi:YbaY family lipoprotein [Streptomyces sp. ISL-98]|uniref:YbaY family lipoprotein n=1 Tax=Streptomyces sp. ISL-98 TaxID=2819192 RepID=UPI001BE70856|nr:YbaY family lipoprotein [Streptomyces sp. ISL-98]MBT2510768.1 YbaY family lipoprotein [Streptomyces sp. ISL-98]
MTRSVTGFVSLPPNAPAGPAARVLVEVRDVSSADAPSTVVGEQVQADIQLAPGGRVPFRVQVPDLDPTAVYGLRVHVDLSGSGILEAGDLITTQATPVPAESTDRLIAPVTVV